MGRPPILNRDELMETARTVFTRKGYEATRLADIAGPLRVTPAAILRHSKSKHALFVESMMQAQIELPEAIRRLQTVSVAENPRDVLRKVAEQMLPFLIERIEHLLAVQMQLRAGGEAFAIPAGVRNRTGAPARALAIVEQYFERLHAARSFQIADTRAAALLFVGGLQSYVILHYILRVAPRPYPLDRFITALLDLWAGGALVRSRRVKRGVRGRGTK